MSCSCRLLGAFLAPFWRLSGAFGIGAVPVFFAAGGGATRRTVASWHDRSVIVVGGCAGASVGAVKAVLEL